MMWETITAKLKHNCQLLFIENIPYKIEYTFLNLTIYIQWLE